MAYALNPDHLYREMKAYCLFRTFESARSTVPALVRISDEGLSIIESNHISRAYLITVSAPCAQIPVNMRRHLLTSVGDFLKLTSDGFSIFVNHNLAAPPFII